MTKVYIFDQEATAHAFAMTAYYLGHAVTQVGSAVISDADVYADVLDKTRAIPAALIATEDKEVK